MLRIYAALVVGLLAVSPADAAPRTWHDRSGGTFKGSFSGVVDGLVVIIYGTRPNYYPLTGFSLEDRDYICKELRDSRQEAKIVELMDNCKRSVGNAAFFRFRDAFDEDGQPILPTMLYGLPVPSPVLVGDEPGRDWTDLAGIKTAGRFARLVPPEHVSLFEGRSETTYPLVIFSTADLNYIKDTLAKDAERPVFPDEPVVEPTNEQVELGYRIFRDRRGVERLAKFERKIFEEVRLRTPTGEENYQFGLFSLDDQIWIRNEEERRRTASQSSSSSSTTSSPSSTQMASLPPTVINPPAGPRTSTGAPYDPAATQPGSPGYLPGLGNGRYVFDCDVCGHKWTGDSQFEKCPHCVEVGNQFKCPNCDFHWSNPTVTTDYCPKCYPELSKSTALVTNTSASGSSSADRNKENVAGGAVRGLGDNQYKRRLTPIKVLGMLFGMATTAALLAWFFKS